MNRFNSNIKQYMSEEEVYNLVGGEENVPLDDVVNEDWAYTNWHPDYWEKSRRNEKVKRVNQLDFNQAINLIKSVYQGSLSIK
jgi:hypothetical protein